jgi:hypothetical protein
MKKDLSIEIFTNTNTEESVVEKSLSQGGTHSKK